MGVVLDLPQSLIEAFPLVGLPVLIFPLVVGKEVLGSQEGSGGRNRGQSWVSPATSGGTRGKIITPGRDTYVSCVPKKKMGYLLGGGFTAPSAISSICSERPVRGWLYPLTKETTQKSDKSLEGKHARRRGAFNLGDASLPGRHLQSSVHPRIAYLSPPPPGCSVCPQDRCFT